MTCEHCGAPALFMVPSHQPRFAPAPVCARCFRDYSAAEQRDAETIPCCECIDPDTGDRCDERTYDRLCDHCRKDRIADRERSMGL